MSSFKYAASLMASAIFLFAVQSNTAAQDTAAFEGELDKTIKSACHSYMIDALPEALSWVKEQIFENSPFCQRVKAAYDAEEINEVMQEQFQRRSASEPTLDRSKKREQHLNITIECQSEYMCLESRIRFQNTPHAVSQKTYDRVASFCDGRYGCIQAFFDDWPREIPKAQSAAPQSDYSFEKILKPSLTPTGAKQIAETKAAQKETPSQPAKVAVATPQSAQRPNAKNLRLHQSLQRACSCSLQGAACFENPYGPIKKRLSQIENQRKDICTRWQASYGTIDNSSSVDNRKMSTELDYVSRFVKDADARGKHLIKLAAEDFERIKYRAYNKIPFRNTFEEEKADKLASGPSPKVGAAPDGFNEPQSKSQDGSVSSAAKTSKAPFLYYPKRLTFGDAKAFCQSKGMHLPTVAEAKPHLKEMVPLGDPFWGIWTTDQNAPDKIIGRYRTLRNNGFTEGENTTFASRVFCFP